MSECCCSTKDASRVYFALCDDSCSVCRRCYIIIQHTLGCAAFNIWRQFIQDRAVHHVSRCCEHYLNVWIESFTHQCDKISPRKVSASGLRLPAGGLGLWGSFLLLTLFLSLFTSVFLGLYKLIMNRLPTHGSVRCFSLQLWDCSFLSLQPTCVCSAQTGHVTAQQQNTMRQRGGGRGGAGGRCLYRDVYFLRKHSETKYHDLILTLVPILSIFGSIQGQSAVSGVTGGEEPEITRAGSTGSRLGQAQTVCYHGNRSGKGHRVCYHGNRL